MTDVYKPLVLNVFFTLLCVSCASVPPAEVPTDGFTLKGKIAVVDSGEHYTANFYWRQQGEDFEIDLWGPLGQGRVQLRRIGDQVAMLNGKGEIIAEGTSEEVMRAQLGWSLPLDVFPAWVQGQPYPHEAARALIYDDDGQLSSFRQLEWLVALDRYQNISSVTQTRRLPRRVTASNEDTRVRLVIAEWQI